MPEHELLWRQLTEIAPEGCTIVPKEHRDWLISMASVCLNCADMPEMRKARIRGLLLATYQAEYRYALAEKVAQRLSGVTDDVPEAAYALSAYYTNTRRYDLARGTLRGALACCDEGRMHLLLRQQLTDCEARASGAKSPYKPVPKADKERILADFAAHLAQLGVDENVPRKRAPSVKGILPLRQPGFRTFVAFDLETTCLFPERGNIIEIGAIRVVDGVVSEEKRFTFQELVFPHEHGIPDEVAELTGITNKMVASARTIQQVLPDFAAFVGTDILMGYNCFHFDCKFLLRACRQAGRDICNQCFDLLPWSKSLVEPLKLSPKGGLAALSRDLNIVNPQAHRALADAATTARAYLRLLELQENIPAK